MKVVRAMTGKRSNRFRKNYNNDNTTGLNASLSQTKNNFIDPGKVPALPLISVIIPVYNVAPFLDRCLDSVQGQTYPNLEMILVDDGSTDASGEICKSRALKDGRIHYYYKDHGGVAETRNYGLRRAGGAYITFVDSDDTVTLDYVEYLFALIHAGSDGPFDMSMCSLRTCYSSNGYSHTSANGRVEILSGKSCIERMCYGDQVDTCVYAKLYNAALFDGIVYPEGRIFEDIGVTYRLFDRCDQVICGWLPKYHYVVRENSIVTSGYSEAKLDLLRMTDQMAAYVGRKYPDMRKAVLRRRFYARFSTLNQMLAVDGYREKKIRCNLIRFIKKYGWQVFFDPRTPWRDRAAFLSLLPGLPVYRFVWGVYYWWKRKRKVRRKAV